QQPGSALSVEVANLADKMSFLSLVGSAWPALLALAVWGYTSLTSRRGLRPVGWIVGWTLLAWATLRSPNGAGAFLTVMGAFLLLQVVIPSLRRLWLVPRASKTTPPETGPAPAVAAILVGGFVWFGTGSASFARSADFQPSSEGTDAVANPRPKPQSPLEATPIAELVAQEIRVEEKFALATAKIRWQAVQGQALPLLSDPAVLTRLTLSSKAPKLFPAPAGSRRAQQLLARESGLFEVEVQYQLQVTRKDTESGLLLPT